MEKKYKVGLITLVSVTIIISATLLLYSCNLNPTKPVPKTKLEDFSLILDASSWQRIEGRVLGSESDVVNTCAEIMFNKSGDSYLVCFSKDSETFFNIGYFSFNPESSDTGKLFLEGQKCEFILHFSENTDSYNCRLSVNSSEYLDFKCKKEK